MDEFNLIEKLARYKKFLLPALLGLIGLVFLGYGLIGYIMPKKEKGDILFEGASTGSATVKSSLSPVSQKQIAVDVEGAVEKPGVYQLGEQSRVKDALIAAGGMSEKADRSKVSQVLNLAAKVIDGAKVYIPAMGETLAQSDQTVLGVSSQSSGPVNINTASLSDLDGLPGIGQTTAAKIVSNRPYNSVEELVQKKVVGQKVFEKIKDKISL